MVTFSEGRVGLDEIAVAIRNSQQLLLQAKNNPTSVINTLDQIAAGSTQLIADIDAAAAAAPNNPALQNLKAEKDLLVAEFTTKRAKAVALETAVAGITL